MTHPAVQRARELAKKATPGPWETDGRQVVEGEYRGPEGNEMVAWFFKPDGTRVENYEANSEFIAAARTLLPELVEAYDATDLECDERSRTIDRLIAERDRVVALNTRLTTMLTKVTDELSTWGMGDFHYGDTPQERRVSEPVAEARVLLAETEKS